MMNEKLKLSQAVIVEGRYDKLKLSNIIDAFIIETNGFSIFKDKEKLKFIKRLANERGIIVMTDSDHAGFMIRNYISSGIPKDRIINVYIPDVFGKEKRKSEPSKEGKIGVEGMSRDVILEALNKAGVSVTRAVNENPVTSFDMFDLGFSGTADAKKKRKKLLKALDLPEFLSTGSLISCINNMMSREEFINLADSLR